MNKFYLPIVIVVFVIASALIIYYGFADDNGGLDSVLNYQNKQNASLTIDFGDKQRMFVGDVIENMTILDALELSSESSDLKYNFDQKINNLAMIDGFSNNGSVWNIYMNGLLVEESPDAIKIKAGDAVELKFEQNLQ
ncbi:MAG: hypothetical protein US76_02660 [Parcubacteria group bacterium GW2011_GWA2_38_13b]|nr:MAG: hypothetical protein US76_02660 [Parcubacteria group bacterium GW2011_GWA2_38_13b]